MKDILELGTSAIATKFCECFQVGIDVYISYRNHQVKPHSSLWFPSALAAAIAHRNNFFCLYQKTKSSKFQVKFRPTSNCYKGALETVKLIYANKTKEPMSSLLKHFVHVTFGKQLI